MKRTEWYKNAIVYQIYPFSFKDSNNDGWGDIKGIISKLDYLKDLGITAIWFSPLYKSPDEDYGYDISDYKDIDPKFGTMDDFKEMVNECHSRDIKVIMDIAINHSSIDHKWFREAMKDKNSPYRDYYIIKEGKKKGKKIYPPTNWDSTFTGSAWERIKGTDDYYLHLFCVEQADLNWENEKVRQEAIDIFKYWMDLGVDGWRLDVFNMFSKVYPLKDGKKKLMGTGGEYYVDGPRMHEFLKELNEKAFSLYDSYTVGESYGVHKDDAFNYIKQDNKELDTIFDFHHFGSDSMAKYFKKKFNLIQFKDGFIGPQLSSYGYGWNTLVLENHDCSRSNSRFGIDVKKYHYESSTFLPTICFLGFGTPYIYMGEEFGTTNAVFENIDDCKDPVSHFIYNMLRKFKVSDKLAMKAIRYGARDHARVPMMWDESANHGFNDGAPMWQKECGNLVPTSFEKDIKSEKSIYKYYQKVLELKKTDIFAYGEIKEYDHKNRKVIAYSRTMGDTTMFVFGNFSNKTVKYSIPDEVNGRQRQTVLMNYEDTIESDREFVLRPYEAIVLKYIK